ncbi:MAG: flavodoxin family protein [Candidatus Bathyarchaeota archaeon]|nr:flavodoxin family protein [Candidatus Bathyarchaeota archaeon]
MEKEDVKAIVVCVSTYKGNTLKIAKAIADVLDAQVVAPHETTAESLGEYDLVGFGSGIFFGNHHQSLLSLVDKLPRGGKQAFIFSTMGRISIYKNTYHKTLRKKLESKSYSIIGEYACRGFSDYYKIFKLFGGVNKGHPNSKDLQNAQTFAHTLTNKTTAATNPA